MCKYTFYNENQITCLGESDSLDFGRKILSEYFYFSAMKDGKLKKAIIYVVNNETGEGFWMDRPIVSAYKKKGVTE